MTISETTLFAILMMVGAVLGIALPLLVYVRGTRLWEEIPRDVYKRFPQRIGRLRPLHVWFAIIAFSLLRDFLAWRHFSGSVPFLKALGGLLLILVLLWQMIWAVLVVRRRSELDARLVRFARFFLWCVSLPLALVICGFVSEYVK